MKASQGKKRRLLVNFFIKPGLQLKMTAVFIFASLVASGVSLLVLYLITRINMDGLEGLRTAWYYLKATFSGFWVAFFVSAMVGLIVGLWASRKIALPIYKVEQWAKAVGDGDLTVRLGMRDNDYWENMANTCNGITGDLRHHILQLKQKKEFHDKQFEEEFEKLITRYRV